MGEQIRIGTRDSKLSLAQAMLVIQAIEKACPGSRPQLVCRKTAGDKLLDRPLVDFGGKGAFVSEFEEGLLRGEIDFAVHSAKDLPMELADGLGILGVLPREDRLDVLVTLKGKKAKGTVSIGTASLRRSLQIKELGKALWPGCQVCPRLLRGNVLTRLDKLEQGLYDGIVLAAAGLKRLDIQGIREGRYEYRVFSEEEMIPAGGQGIIAVEGRRDDRLNWIIRRIIHQETMEELLVERMALKRLNAGCHEPVGVSCRRDEDGFLVLDGFYGKGGVLLRARAEEKECLESTGKERMEQMALLLAGRLGAANLA